MDTKTPLPIIVAAAVTAVAFWSFKPIFITLIGARAGYGEVFVAAGSISLVASLLGALLLWRRTLTLLQSPGAWRGVVQAVIAGLFLAMWYYGFYRALYGAKKTDATIIAFSWPLISIIAMRWFAPGHGRPLSTSQIALIVVAFLGAIAIGVADLSNPATFSSNGELLFAFVAAIGSGFYLPFAMNAIQRFGVALNSKLLGTFYTISIANLASLTLVWSAMSMTGTPLRFFAFDTEVIAICALIGIGTYLVAEITWTWAFSEYDSLTLSSLPYFSPAVSVVLLYVFFDEPVTAIAALGLVLILFSNMTLHARYHSNNAPVMALVATVYVALASQMLHPVKDGGPLVDIMYAISGLFAILAGFVLSRVSGRRAQEIDARTTLVRGVLSVRDGTEQTDDVLDRALRALTDIEFTTNLLDKEVLASTTRAVLGQLSDSQNHLAAFDSWFMIHRDRLSQGEKAALWITGVGSILFLMILRPDSVFGLIGLYAFSAGCLLLIFTIRDYEQNNLHGFRSQLLRLQQGFSELGRSYYLPQTVVFSREIAGLPEGATVRYRAETGKLTETTLSRSSSSFSIIYWASSALVLGALIYLPVSSGAPDRSGSVQTLRPGVVSERLSEALLGAPPDLVIARFDWRSSQVSAAILQRVLADRFDLNVQVQAMTVSDVFPEMDAEKVDVHPEFWAENQPANLARYIETDAPVAGMNQRGYLGTQGIYTQSDTADLLEITSFADLHRPEVAAAYDHDGDGLGEIWLGAPGWKSTALMQEMLISTGLEDLWEGEAFSDQIFKAKLARFQANGLPLIFYGYQPDSVHSLYDLTDVSGLDRRRGDDINSCPAGLPRQLCSLSFTHVHIAYATRLTDSNPEVAALLSAVAFKREDVSGWLARMVQDGLSADDVAAEWVRANRDVVDAWASRQEAAQGGRGG